MNRATNPYAGYRYPGEIISHAVWLYFRLTLSCRDIEEWLAAWGILVTYETIRQWCLKLGQPFANEVQRRLPRPGDQWHLDEVYLKMNGQLRTGKRWISSCRLAAISRPLSDFSSSC